MSKRGLLDVHRQAPLPQHTNLLVIVDQFEELFRYRSVRAAKNGRSRAEDAVSFVNLLIEVRRQMAPHVYVALTMRSDFLGGRSILPHPHPSLQK